LNFEIIFAVKFYCYQTGIEKKNVEIFKLIKEISFDNFYKIEF